ncbi:MAG: inositol monophosphatase [Candidatus Aenigmarchaeota archaeon]|nr:inositol monophosphatase [Candidatus Aenigmarchaeota archaeon]
MFSEELELAKKLAMEAGKIVMDRFGSYKDMTTIPRSMVTDADQESSAYIIGEISKCFPKHVVISEETELGAKLNTTESMKEVLAGYTSEHKYCWIVDPLDGTMNFAYGRPEFSIAIGLIRHGEPVAGVVYAPYDEDLYFAEKGAGSFFVNNRHNVRRKITVLACELQNAIVAYDWGMNHDAMKYFVRKIPQLAENARGLRQQHGSALGLCYVANGRSSAYIDFDVKPWDIAAALVILKEAGAAMTDINGKKISIASANVMASNGKIHNKLLTMLGGYNE